MDNEKNPYSTPTNAASVSTLEGNQKSGAVIGPVPPFRDPVGMRLNRLFAYSYMLSLVVGISVAVAWVCLMIMASPQAQMPSSPDILQLAFVFITTLPAFLPVLYLAGSTAVSVRRQPNRQSGLR